MGFAGDCILTITNGTSNIGGSPFNFTSYFGNMSIPHCSGSWLNDKSMFKAGEQMFLVVAFKDKRRNLVEPVFPYTQFSTSIRAPNGTKYKTDVNFLPGSTPSHGIIIFNVTLVGNFSLYVGDNRSQIQNSPFPFRVLSGSVFAGYSKGFWLRGINTFQAGKNATLMVERYDAYKNKISPLMSTVLYFYTTRTDGSLLDEKTGLEGFTRHNTLIFAPMLSGTFLLHVTDRAENEIQGSPFNFSVTSGDADAKNCLSRWTSNINTFKAGSKGSLQILLMDEYNNSITILNNNNYNSTFEAFTRSISGTKGVLDLRVVPDSTTGYVTVTFLAISIGNYSLHVAKSNQSIPGSPFAFEVVSAEISTLNCKGAWLNGLNIFQAGDPASVLIQFLDAYNNNVTRQNKPLLLYQLSEGSNNRKSYKIKRIELKPGYEIVTFLATTSGNVSLHVTDANNVEIRGSPFPFTVNPGPLALLNTTAEWQYGVRIFQVYGIAKLYIYPRDKYSNALSLKDGNLQGLVYQENSNDPFPVPDLLITPHHTINWIQVLSFTTGTPGRFKLYVRDASLGNIAMCPYAFEVFEGNIDANATVVSGSGLNKATAGEVAGFTVEVRSNEGQPTGSPPDSVSVLLKKEDAELPSSFKYMAGTIPREEEELAAAVSTASSKNVSIVAGNSIGSFQATYYIAPGRYELYVLWTNIILNDGKPFQLTVLPGMVDISRCRCYKDNKTRTREWSYINVLLYDSLGNAVPGKAGSLHFYVSSREGENRKRAVTDTAMGSYITAYKPARIGVYILAVLYNGIVIPSCKMTDIAHSDNFYPRANDDYSRVMRGDVVIIDVLSNDGGGAAPLSLYNITEVSLLMPSSMIKHIP